MTKYERERWGREKGKEVTFMKTAAMMHQKMMKISYLPTKFVFSLSLCSISLSHTHTTLSPSPSGVEER
jgi:hypothetical protein